MNPSEYYKRVGEEFDKLGGFSRDFFEDMYDRLMHAETDASFNYMKRDELLQKTQQLEKENKELKALLKMVYDFNSQDLDKCVRDEIERKLKEIT